MSIKKIDRKWSDELQGLETFLTLEHIPADPGAAVRRVVVLFDVRDAGELTDEELLDRTFVVKITDAPRRPGKQKKVDDE